MGTPTFADQIFVEHIQKVLNQGVWADPQQVRPKFADGTPANFKYLTDVYMKFDLSQKEFPITTLRPIALKLAIEEILWIWQDQSSDLNKLEKRGVHWWQPWALDDGTIGERYGKTVHNYDILNRTLTMLSQNPYNRRSIMSLWQYTDLDQPEQLPPCVFQVAFDVRKQNTDGRGQMTEERWQMAEDRKQTDSEYILDCILFQRSSDFLVAGLGINQMQYVALQMMVAKHLGYKVGTFSWHIMNLHIYERHLDQAQELLQRFANYPSYEIDNSELDFQLNAPDPTDFYQIQSSDFELSNYQPIRPQLKFELAI